MRSERTVKATGRTSHESRFYLSSAEPAERRPAQWHALVRGHWRPRFAFRTATEWRAELTALGFEVSLAPMSEGTPFANVMLVARVR